MCLLWDGQKSSEDKLKVWVPQSEIICMPPNPITVKDCVSASVYLLQKGTQTPADAPYVPTCVSGIGTWERGTLSEQ